jgi:hypothetical protein
VQTPPLTLGLHRRAAMSGQRRAGWPQWSSHRQPTAPICRAAHRPHGGSRSRRHANWQGALNGSGRVGRSCRLTSTAHRGGVRWVWFCGRVWCATSGGAGLWSAPTPGCSHARPGGDLVRGNGQPPVTRAGQLAQRGLLPEHVCKPVCPCRLAGKFEAVNQVLPWVGIVHSREAGGQRRWVVRTSRAPRRGQSAAPGHSVGIGTRGLRRRVRIRCTQGCQRAGRGHRPHTAQPDGKQGTHCGHPAGSWGEHAVTILAARPPYPHCPTCQTQPQKPRCLRWTALPLAVGRVGPQHPARGCMTRWGPAWRSA